MNFKLSLKMALAIRDKSATDLSNESGITKSQLTNWSKSGNLTLRNLERVCNSLGMSVSDFVALGESKEVA